MDYLKIVSYKGYEVNVKRTKKQRSDKKHTIQALLSKQEKLLVNEVMYQQGYGTIVDFVTDAVANGIHLTIIKADLVAAKRYLREADGIQVNGRLNGELYDHFRLLQAKANINQRQLTLVLIKKAVEMAGYRWS
ncbi:hypothetical protein JOC25_000011 [Solibacillus kalamii]|uniref:Resolvase/invertase-type recombinase catalytic domain-containing protein n=1 Tax=Solibacillus kalamii TaxID=1748298 RepID=A0ABX3ZHH9_9BACL|nr:hypothetical protein [Solibacillus kalamii]MBM7663555.1 hypothetical protein [Solibacillus kalamii]OUZ39181.1 hypothetical protein CBM15_09990 [Solibacillus kalamii]